MRVWYRWRPHVQKTIVDRFSMPFSGSVSPNGAIFPYWLFSNTHPSFGAILGKRYCWGPALRQSFCTWQMALDLGPSRPSKNIAMWHPNVPLKNQFELPQRALFWGSHFTLKNARSLPIYLGKHKEPAILLRKNTRKNTRSPPGAHHFTWKNTRSPPGAHHFTWKNTKSPPKPIILFGKTQGAHREPTILLGKTQEPTRSPPFYLEKHKEPTRSPPFYLEKHKEPTRSPPFHLEKHKEPTRSPPFYLQKHKEPTKSPPFYLEKHKEPNLSPNGKYNNHWEVAEVAGMRKEDCNFATINIILQCLA